MSDWTPVEDTDLVIPTTDMIRNLFTAAYPDRAKDFDQWLAKEKAITLRQAARDLQWFGAQGNTIHPDTAWAGVKACITALENVANEKDGK